VTPASALNPRFTASFAASHASLLAPALEDAFAAVFAHAA